MFSTSPRERWPTRATELSRTREDPIIGYLLWTGPYATPGRGVLSFSLPPKPYESCMSHLEALTALRHAPLDRYRGDILGRLSLLLSELGRVAQPWAAHDEVAALVGGKSLWTARVSSRSAVRAGAPLELAIDTSRLHFFDPASGESIGHPHSSVPGPQGVG
jgi:hypothetical protein